MTKDTTEQSQTAQPTMMNTMMSAGKHASWDHEDDPATAMNTMNNDRNQPPTFPRRRVSTYSNEGVQTAIHGLQMQPELQELLQEVDDEDEDASAKEDTAANVADAGSEHAATVASTASSSTRSSNAKDSNVAKPQSISSADIHAKFSSHSHRTTAHRSLPDTETEKRALESETMHHSMTSFDRRWHQPSTPSLNKRSAIPQMPRRHNADAKTMPDPLASPTTKSTARTSTSTHPGSFPTAPQHPVSGPSPSRHSVHSTPDETGFSMNHPQQFPNLRSDTAPQMQVRLKPKTQFAPQQPTRQSSRQAAPVALNPKQSYPVFSDIHMNDAASTIWDDQDDDIDTVVSGGNHEVDAAEAAPVQLLTKNRIRALLSDMYEDLAQLTERTNGKVGACKDCTKYMSQQRKEESWNYFFDEYYKPGFVWIRSSGNPIHQEGLVKMFTHDISQLNFILVSVDSIRILAAGLVAVVDYTADQRFTYKNIANEDRTVVSCVMEIVDGKIAIAHEHRTAGRPIPKATRWS